MAPREELLVILDLTSTVLRAGVGVTDLIRGPLLELPTRIGRKKGTKGSQVEDYLVGYYLSQAETGAVVPEEGFEIVCPLEMDPKVGFNVTDWVGLEAIFRYALHTSLQLARPPLAHSTVLSVPPSLPHSTTDRLHQLLFERLLVPSLLLSSRPFFAAGAAGITSGLVLDIGWRGEGCEISVVYENQVFEQPGGSRLGWVDEGVLDDFAAVKIWQENREHLLDAFRKAKDGQELSQGDLLDGVRRVVGELKNQDLIGFESKHYKASQSTASGTAIEAEEDGSFDVAKAVVEGKVSDIVNKKKTGKNASNSTTKPEGDYVTIPNPFSPPPPPPPVDLTIPAPEIPEHANLSIGPSRHSYLEPLFFPQVLSTHLSSRNEAAKEIGLTYFESIQVPHAGIQELIGTVLNEIEDKDVREAVSENLVVVSSGKVACNKALGTTLVPLLSPYVQSPISIDLYAEGGPTYNKLAMKFARTPDYFSNFKKNGGDWAVYLGECIMGKLLIGDQQSKLFMSKADYAQKGPAYYRQLDLIT
ncbi:uncharacterized protein JCM6883_001187 [Sporobolomyces salmoneus]|uniref:uncharacterized protein n=1 Tax=Sporobolomyces salmoneus TaxID=183962 RepID=UPI003170D71C